MTASSTIKPPRKDKSVSKKADELIKAEAEAVALRFTERWETLKAKCESPIEEILLAALICDAETSEYKVEFMSGSNPPDEPYFDQAAFVYQQAKVGPYRVDFIIQDATIPFEIAAWRWMIVECDGHDFHERTKEQARRDKRRDRFFQSKGFKVLRFTGSEIWADPENCASEVINELACNDYWRNRDL